MKRNKQTDQIRQVKDGLPKEAYAIATDPYASETWLLPHHTPKGEVDWDIIPFQVAALTGTLGAPFAAPPEIVLDAARHLAKHYEEANKPIPDALAALL
jgi:hypothetical protein